MDTKRSIEILIPRHPWRRERPVIEGYLASVAKRIFGDLEVAFRWSVSPRAGLGIGYRDCEPEPENHEVLWDCAEQIVAMVPDLHRR